MPTSVIESLLTSDKPAVIASPFVEELWAKRALGRDPYEKSGLKYMLACAKLLKCELLYGGGDVDLFQALPERVRQSRVTERGDGIKVRRTVWKTPCGALTNETLCYAQAENPATVTAEPFLKQSGDYAAFNWCLEKIEDSLASLSQKYRASVAQAVAAVGGRGLVYSSGPMPCFLLNLANWEDLIWHWTDFPETMLAATRRVHRIEQALMVAAAEAGARVFRFCVGGRECYTPEVFAAAVEPFLAEDVALLKARGAFAYIHTCGHMRDQLRGGYLNRIKPHLVESFSAPPEGDIEDLRWAREQLDPAICTRGNVSLTMLRNGPVTEITRAVERIVSAVRGYRHIVSGTDSVHAGTPLENVAALAAAVG